MKQPQSSLLFLSVLTALLLATAPAVRRAHADTTTSTALDPSTTTTLSGGDDMDDDGVSDGEDNCPDVADASQDDLDGDGSGDVCDSTDAELDDDSVIKVTPASDTSAGGVVGKGTFTASGAEDDSVDDGGDVTIEISDSDSMDETVDVSTDDCGESGDGASVGCSTPAATVKLKRSSKAPGLYKYKIKLRGVSATKAPTPPVTVRIQHGAHKTDRVGQLSTCTSSGAKTVCTK